MAHNFRTKEETARHNRRVRRQVLGAVLTVLMVVGLFTVVTSSVKSIAGLFDDSKEKAEFEKRLNNLVMLDPLPFGTLEQADPIVLKTAALWASLSTAQENHTLELYDRDPDDMSLYLPAVDVDAAAASLYGPDYKIVHGTLQDDNIVFLYDEVRKAYKIPPTSQGGLYYPKVETMKKHKGILRVTVGYVSSYSTDEFGLPTASDPEKYMDYLFKKQDGKWYLAAIQESETKVEKPVATPQPMMDFSTNAVENPQQILEQQTTESESQNSTETQSEPQMQDQPTSYVESVANSEETNSDSDSDS